MGIEPCRTAHLFSMPHVYSLLLGEGPYAEGGGDTREARIKASDEALIAQCADGKRKIIVLLICGRPLVIPQETMKKIDALVVGWLPGTEGDGIADILFGAVQLTGRLSYSWPRDGKQMTKESREETTRSFRLATASSTRYRPCVSRCRSRRRRRFGRIGRK